jgi:GPH family glycoside/pentoside/hexuronide:cation symporter
MAEAAWSIPPNSPAVTDAEPPAAPPVARAGFRTRFLYGFGSIAFGVKDNGFQTILLIFYNQVVGLPAAMVGLAIMFALVIDAVMDPIIGQWSDNFHSRWGRRHPFMYASALPLGLSYLLLWNPPHASQGVQFAYLVVVAIVVRTFISVYEAPSQALGPELTTDYAERTSLTGYRVFFAWFGGLAMYFLAFTVLLKPDATHKIGQLNPVGYAHYGMVACCVMVVSILISAMGTHSRIKTLTTPPRRALSLGLMLRETLQTLKHRSFLMLIIAILFSSAATGVAFSMSVYFYTYVWRLSALQISVFAIVNLISAFLSVPLANALSRKNKRNATMALFIIGIFISVAPLTLRLLNVFAANGSSMLYPLLLGFSLVGLTLMIAAGTLAISMIADVVEDSQLRTGRRSEGLFFAASSFTQKAVSGLGIFLSGLILSLVHFPADAGKTGAPVDPTVIRHLIMLYLPLVAVLYLIAALWLLGYRITRKSHEANLLQLAEAGEAIPLIPGA